MNRIPHGENAPKSSLAPRSIPQTAQMHTFPSPAFPRYTARAGAVPVQRADRRPPGLTRARPRSARVEAVPGRAAQRRHEPDLFRDVTDYARVGEAQADAADNGARDATRAASLRVKKTFNTVEDRSDTVEFKSGGRCTYASRGGSAAESYPA
jgi:hypothetical protein